jgi:hypothetical protein
VQVSAGARGEDLRTRVNGQFVLVAVGFGLLALADLALLAVSMPRFFGARAVDWAALVGGGEQVRQGLDPYVGGGFIWSPVAAWLFVPLSLLGMWGWRLLHVVAALAMPSWRLRIATLAWWAFWIDAAFGDNMTFALLLAVWAATGKRWAQLGFVALVCLAPKPIFIPFLLWLLMTRPGLRQPAAAIIVANAALVALAGHGREWLQALAHRGSELTNVMNLSPSAVVGAWWLPVGITLAVLFYRRRLFGLAGLAFSPYWLPYYFLMPLLDLVRPRAETMGADDAAGIPNKGPDRPARLPFRSPGSPPIRPE